MSDYPLTIKPQFNAVKSFFVTSCKSFTLDDYLHSENISFERGKRHLRYNLEKFENLAFIQTAMCLQKYDVATLTKAHIIYNVIATLFYFFRTFEDGTFVFDRTDISVILGMILNADINVYAEIADTYHFTVIGPRTRTKDTKKRPTCAEDLTSCFTPGMTQTEKKEAIMKWWRCGSSTARAYMSEFGLTEKKYAHSGSTQDVQEIHTHIDEVAESLDDAICTQIEESNVNQTAIISENLEISKDSIISSITDELSEKMDRQHSELVKLINGVATALDVSIGRATDEVLAVIAADVRKKLESLQMQISRASTIIEEQEKILEKLQRQCNQHTVIYQNGVQMGTDTRYIQEPLKSRLTAATPEDVQKVLESIGK